MSSNQEWTGVRSSGKSTLEHEIFSSSVARKSSPWTMGAAAASASSSIWARATSAANHQPVWPIRRQGRQCSANAKYRAAIRVRTSSAASESCSEDS